MKKLLLALALILLLIGNIFSQSAPNVFVKWAPATLMTGKITVGTEINFTRKSSVDLMIGIPSTKTRTINYDDKQSDIDSKAFSALLGYRYYFGKRAARGVYLEPYAKYLRHEGHGIINGDLSDKVSKMDTYTKYEGLGAGAQLGVQFMLFKRLSVDFYFLGIEANSSKFSSTSTDIANSLPWTFIQSNEARSKMEDAIDGVPFISRSMKITVDQDRKNVSTEYKGFLPGLRFGASIGIRF